MATMAHRPVHAGENASIRATAAIAEHLPGKDFTVVCDAVAWRLPRLKRSASSADAVCAVAMLILHRLIRHKRLSLDGSAGKVRMAQVEAGIEYGHANAPAREV